MENRKKRIAVLFDLDGTLWDAADTIAPAWNDWCRAHGIDRRFTPEEFRGWCGKTMPDIAAAAFPQADPAWREAVIDGCSEAECIPLSRDGGRLYPGLEGVLKQLHREHFLAVVSNCGLGYIEAFFSGNHVGQWFDDYENATRTGRPKAENIRLVMERNGLERAVYVGDTEWDHQAACAAGVPFLHAAYGYGKVSGADGVLSQITDLPEILDKL